MVRCIGNNEAENRKRHMKYKLPELGFQVPVKHQIKRSKIIVRLMAQRFNSQKDKVLQERRMSGDPKSDSDVAEHAGKNMECEIITHVTLG